MCKHKHICCFFTDLLVLCANISIFAVLCTNIRRFAKYNLLELQHPRLIRFFFAVVLYIFRPWLLLFLCGPLVPQAYKTKQIKHYFLPPSSSSLLSRGTLCEWESVRCGASNKRHQHDPTGEWRFSMGCLPWQANNYNVNIILSFSNLIRQRGLKAAAVFSQTVD